MAIIAPRSGKRMQEKASAHTTTSYCWVDIDGDHGSRGSLTEANDRVTQLSYKDSAAAYGRKVTIRRAIEQPTIDNLRPIVSCAKDANGRHVKLVQP